MPEAPFGARRPRPVADVPPPALLDGQVTAKGWLLGLVAARPLAEAAALTAGAFARDAPALCAAVLRAVGSEADLGRLQPGGDLAALAAASGALAGAGDPSGVVAGLGALRAAAWEALTAVLHPLDAATTAALAERLAYVCEVVAAAALAEATAPPAAWEDALRRALDRGAVALVAVEVADAARLAALGEERALADAERALREAAGPGAVVAREDDGRLWVVAPGLGLDESRALAERLTAAVAQVAPVRGAPLAAAAGVAIHPADGLDADALTARAEERLYEARAAGVPVA
jgi:Diguanylate cyclase, GGDEF domain